MDVNLDGVNVLEPMTFALLLVGAMIPYWIAALTMRSVCIAAGELVQEVKRTFELKDSQGLTILSGSTISGLNWPSLRSYVFWLSLAACIAHVACVL